MKLLIALIAMFFVGFGVDQVDAQEQGQDHDHATEMITLTPDDIVWQRAPDVLPLGAQIAYLSGDMTKEGVWTARLKLPANYQIPAHYHGAFEYVTVISGEFLLGSGKVFDQRVLKSLPAGSFFVMPPEHVHFAMTKVETVIQIHADQPFTMTYVEDNKIKP